MTKVSTINNKQPKKGRYIRFREKTYPFFWFVAAAEENILKTCPVPEQDKLASVGMAILCTTVAAMLSSYYAIHSLFGSLPIALLLSAFWGIIIFNLDRFMVGSLRKNKHKNILREIAVASPRIVLAVLIAVLISKPLEVKIFEHQIEAEETGFNEQLAENTVKNRTLLLAGQKAERDSVQRSLDKTNSEKGNLNLDPSYVIAKKNYDQCLVEKKELEDDLYEKRNQRKELYNTRAQLTRQKEYLVENNQTDGISQLDEQISRTNTNISNINQGINSINSRIKELGCTQKYNLMLSRETEYVNEQTTKANEIKNLKDSLDDKIIEDDTARIKTKNTALTKYRIAAKDILGQLRILNSLQKKDTGMKIAGYLIMALFFVLEISPLAVKILSPRGEYDSLIAVAEKQAFDREEALEEESRQETKARKEAALHNTIQVRELDEKTKEKIQERILEAQATLAEEIVAAWEEQQKEELKADKAEYLKSKIHQSI